MVNYTPYWRSVKGCCPNNSSTEPEYTQLTNEEILSEFDALYPHVTVQNFVLEFPEFKEILDQLKLGEDYLTRTLSFAKLDIGFSEWGVESPRLVYLLTAHTIMMRYNQISDVASKAVSASKGEASKSQLSRSIVKEPTTVYIMELERIQKSFRPTGGFYV